jgi:2-iminobutanoate/2-iminopropanoate deaminase
MKKQIIVTDQAPKAIGPYSAGIRADQFIYTAGQLGFDPATGEFVPGGIEAETRRALENIKAILSVEGATMEQIVKTTVYLRDMGDFTAMNGVYAEFFPQDPPARTTIQAAGLPRGAAVEIEAIAILL